MADLRNGVQKVRSRMDCRTSSLLRVSSVSQVRSHESSAIHSRNRVRGMSDYPSWLGKNAVLFNPMTEDEQREHDYRVDERLGVLAEGQAPTPERERIARDEANRWLLESRLSQRY